ncbi:hypothetical protein [Tenuibacillus multivorans]|uniref:Acyl-CoA dehydrogenase n=1 Tax=Tenuibacillus multivorans TaxID=237069 RepID=A0A1H0DXI9_9BACI|nr:hypothetical protein [Tenuibacillus multivorans]GEL76743.1 hydroxylase [Tenuibacillus multivorans]SDN74743.1 Acyl-CoA dehydrogenase [Tenuibacillus multivorans]
MFSQKDIQLIRSQSREIESSGELTREILELIYEKKLFKLFVPNELNGNMTPFPEAIKIFEDAAYIDGSFGWLVQIGSGAGFFVTTMNPKVAKDIFSKRDIYIAGSDRPSGTARKVDGGYIVNGEWKFASGSKNATIFTANCQIEVDGEIVGMAKAFTFTAEQVEIIEDWEAFGLKGTNSHTFRVQDVFVPEEYTFDVMKPHFHYDDPVYHYPFLPFSVANIASTTIGIAKHFFEEARAYAGKKKETWDPNRYETVIEKIKQSEQPYIKDVQAFYQSIEQSWDTHLNGETVTDDQLIDIMTKSQEVAHSAVSGAQVIFRYLGMDAIMESTELNRIYRDLHTASQHKLLVSYE